MNDLVSALAKTDQPEATFKALERRVQDVIGAKLFTLTDINLIDEIAHRFYTNMPVAYPVSGEKKITPNAWTAQVLERHQTFVANTIDEIAQVFPDHDLIQSLGCESCINIPIVVRGRVIGTLNCLHEAHHYTPSRVKNAEGLKHDGALAFLLRASLSV